MPQIQGLSVWDVILLASLQVSMWSTRIPLLAAFASMPTPLYSQVVSEHHLAFLKKKKETSPRLTSTGVLFLSSKLILFFISMFKINIQFTGWKSQR